MILKKIKVEDLLYDANTDIMETNLKLSDYDWMHYQLTGKFRTEEMGTLEVTFEFIGIAACDMTIVQTFKKKSRKVIYEFSTDIYKKHLLAFMQKHIASWDDEYAFSGEEEIVSFFNEVLETGTLKEVKDIVSLKEMILQERKEACNYRRLAEEAECENFQNKCMTQAAYHEQVAESLRELQLCKARTEE